jgi:electron transfer flavoprotein alpha subunit
MMINVLTFCFAMDGAVPRTALEIIAGARQLTEATGGGRVQTFLCGADVAPDNAALYADALAQHGADDLFLASDHLQSYQTELILEILERVVRQLSPAVILLPHDNLGSEVGARLAYRLEADIVTDCTGFRVEENIIHWLKPVYGGKALAAMVTGGWPQIVTVRSRAFEPLAADPARQSSITTIHVDLEASPSPIILHDIIRETAETIPLDQAQVIVGGGRGMGNPEAFVQLEELAQVLGGAVGGSRPAADSGWVLHSQLIGQTGKIVAPDLYIAVGISGAPQHMVGAGAAQTIVAINKDPDAPIFKVAHLGVVDEWQNVIPAFVTACRELQDTGVIS